MGAKKTPEERAQLSIRERQVAELLAIGKSSVDIAIALEISQKTVDTHRAHVMQKLGLANNVQLARHALRAGWVTLAEPEAA